MEQTLTSDTEALVGRISKMTIFEQFAQTFFVDDKIGVIEIQNTFREKESHKFVKTEISYELKNHRIISKNINSSNIIISDLTESSTITIDKSICRCVSSDLNKLFIQELSRFEKIQKYEFNFFNQNIFKRLFFPNKHQDLINKFKEVGENMSWAIIPYKLLPQLYKSEELKLSKEDNEKLIYNLGSLNHIEIYVNPDDDSNKIYFGNYESIIILANKNMNIFENNQGMNYNIEYLFIENGLIKSLQID